MVFWESSHWGRFSADFTLRQNSFFLLLWNKLSIIFYLPKSSSQIHPPFIMLIHHIACSISCVSVFQSNLMQYLLIYFIAQSHILLCDLTTVKEKRTLIYQKCLHTLRKYIVPKSWNNSGNFWKDLNLFNLRMFKTILDVWELRYPKEIMNS